MTIRWGILGCGDVARKRVAAAIQNHDGSELVGACRRNQRRLKQFCADFNVPFATTSAEELIQHDATDALYIATPVDRHCPQTIAAARAGRHVLVEKPMALSVDECDAMIAACAEADVRLGVAYYRPFYPVIARMQQLIADGAIGRVLSVSAVTSTPFAIAENEDGYWRVIPEHGGGGALMDIGSHRLDLFLHLFGPIRRVQGICSTVAASYAADDAASVILEFESGIHGSVNCFFGSTVDPDEFAVHGTTGRLVSRPLNSGELEIESDGRRRIEQHPPCNNFNTPLVEDFVTAIHEHREPLVNGTRGRAVNQIIAQAYQSSAAR